MAELLGAHCAGKRLRKVGHQWRNSAARSEVPALRGPSGPRIHRWPGADWAAVLHEFSGPAICPRNAGIPGRLTSRAPALYARLLFHLAKHILVVVDGDAVNLAGNGRFDGLGSMRRADIAHLDRFVAHICVERYDILPRVGHSGTRQLRLKMRFAVGGVIDRNVKIVLRLAHAIYIFVEKPIHLVIAVSVHGWRHVLFDDGAKILGRS